jgi:hypothetical protein
VHDDAGHAVANGLLRVFEPQAALAA